MLVSHAGIEDTRVLDLYAGSGSFGLECLSRGAAHVTFVEMDRRAAGVIEKNLEHLDFADRAVVRTTTVALAVAGTPPVDLAFCDPPYADDPWAELLPALKADVMVGHADHDIMLTPDWEEVRRRSYGRAKVVLAARIA